MKILSVESSRSRNIAMMRRAALLVVISCGVLAGAALFNRSDPSDAAGPTTIASPDTAGDVGAWTSMALDSAGNPVVSYHDVTNSTLKVLHCGNSGCTSGNTITSPAEIGPGDVESRATSLELDTSGFPVVSFARTVPGPNWSLRILHCGDATCSSGNSVSPVGSFKSGLNSSLELDSLGYPVISYQFTSSLYVMHCDDANCAGLAEVERFVDGGYSYTSLELDSAGRPVVSYYQDGSSSLKVARCGDANCDAGNIAVTADDSGAVGSHPSLALDASQRPVVSYYDASNGDLKVLRCGNPTCQSGNTSVTMDSAGDVGQYTSIALDSMGNPVVSYYDVTYGDLKVLFCGNATCSSNNQIRTLDSADDVGQYSSLTLDSNDEPVVAYYDVSNADLKVIHCFNHCQGIVPTLPPKTPEADTDGDTAPNDVDGDDDNDGCIDSAELDPKSLPDDGGFRDAHNFWDFFDTPDDSNVRDKAVAGTDFFRILQRFGATGSASIDPLTAPPAAPAYHTAFDRGASSGPNVWNLTAADGAVAGTDFFAVLVQFGHSCA